MSISCRRIRVMLFNPHNWTDKGVYTFLKGISLKVNVTMWLKKREMERVCVCVRTHIIYIYIYLERYSDEYYIHITYKIVGNDNIFCFPGRVIPKTLKMVLDTSLLNTQQNKVSIKGKVEQSKERRSALPYISV